MSRLDQMPEITEHVLSGLRADDSMKFRIFQEAAGISGQPLSRKSHRPLVAALCAVSALMIVLFVLINPLVNTKKESQSSAYSAQNSTTSQIQTIQAGSELDESPVISDHEKESSPEEEKDDSSAEEDDSVQTTEP